MLSIALAILNFIALSHLKERQGFQEEVPTFIKVIILLPPLGLVCYFVVELIDCVIRILDSVYGRYHDVDIDKIMQEKIAYNASRPYLHGKRL